MKKQENVEGEIAEEKRRNKTSKNNSKVIQGIAINPKSAFHA